MNKITNDIDKIFNESSMLTEAEMDSYLSGSMSEQDKFKFEKRLEESDLNKDALEGYSQIKNKEQSRKYISQIRKKIPYLIGGVALWKTPWTYVAASIVVAISTVAFWESEPINDVENKTVEKEMIVLVEDETLEETNPLTQEEIEEATPQAVTNPKEETEIRQDETQPSIQPSPVVDEQELEPSPPSAAPNKPRYTEEETKPTRDVTLNSMVPVAHEMHEYSMTNFSYDDQIDKLLNPKRKKSKKDFSDLSSIENWEAGLVLFKQEKFGEAAKRFDQALKKDPFNKDLLFFGGIAHLRSDNVDLSIKKLGLIMDSKSYNEDVNWYLAQGYLKKENKHKARFLLKDLKSSKRLGSKSREILDKIPAH